MNPALPGNDRGKWASALLAVFVVGFWLNARHRLEQHRGFLRICLLMLPVPWIACELGWFVAEFGRQPWTVDGVLPTALSVSHLSAADLAITLAGFVTFYSVLFIIEMGLMLKYIRKGPTQDVAETDAWQRQHEARLMARDTPVTQPAE